LLIENPTRQAVLINNQQSSINNFSASVVRPAVRQEKRRLGS
jgi:hypothetical protein